MMDDGLFELIAMFFSETWNLVTSVYVPGTRFTYGAVLVVGGLMTVMFRVLSMIAGGMFDGSAANQRSTSRKGKISDARKGDEI